MFFQIYFETTFFFMEKGNEFVRYITGKNLTIFLNLNQHFNFYYNTTENTHS